MDAQVVQYEVIRHWHKDDVSELAELVVLQEVVVLDELMVVINELVVEVVLLVLEWLDVQVLADDDEDEVSVFAVCDEVDDDELYTLEAPLKVDTDVTDDEDDNVVVLLEAMPLVIDEDEVEDDRKKYDDVVINDQL